MTTRLPTASERAVRLIQQIDLPRPRLRFSKGRQRRGRGSPATLLPGTRRRSQALGTADDVGQRRHDAGKPAASDSGEPPHEC
jgi:hypothetical protein